jgi:hypothetical protein
MPFSTGSAPAFRTAVSEPSQLAPAAAWRQPSARDFDARVLRLDLAAWQSPALTSRASGGRLQPDGRFAALEIRRIVEARFGRVWRNRPQGPVLRHQLRSVPGRPGTPDAPDDQPSALQTRMDRGDMHGSVTRMANSLSIPSHGARRLGDLPENCHLLPSAAIL